MLHDKEFDAVTTFFLLLLNLKVPVQVSVCAELQKDPVTFSVMRVFVFVLRGDVIIASPLRWRGTGSSGLDVVALAYGLT
jgi:hypothetical protein